MKSLLRRARALLPVLLLLPTTAITRQDERRKANPDDVKSIDSIIKATYDVVSGPAGKRDWDRLRSLFVDKARFGIVHEGRDGTMHLDNISVEDYIREDGDIFLTLPFYEKELFRKTEQWDRMAQVFSSYASRKDPSDKQTLTRGINSFQLLNDGRRWWITSITWEEESSRARLPDEWAGPKG